MKFLQMLVQLFFLLANFSTRVKVKELRLLKTDPLDEFNVHFSCVILVDHISTNFSTNFLCINTLTSMLQQTSFNHSRLSEFVFTYMTAIILNILDDVLSCASSAFLVIIKKNVHRSQSNLLKTTYLMSSMYSFHVQFE